MPFPLACREFPSVALLVPAVSVKGNSVHVGEA